MWWLVGDVFVDGTSCVRAIVVVPVVLCVMCVIYMFDQVRSCAYFATTAQRTRSGHSHFVPYFSTQPGPQLP